MKIRLLFGAILYIQLLSAMEPSVNQRTLGTSLSTSDLKSKVQCKDEKELVINSIVAIKVHAQREDKVWKYGKLGKNLGVGRFLILLNTKEGQRRGWVKSLNEIYLLPKNSESSNFRG